MVSRNKGVIFNVNRVRGIGAIAPSPYVRNYQPIEGQFQPTDVDNLVLWLRADQGVILTSGKVSSWQDQSGLGNHVTQSNAAKRPTLGILQNGGGREAIQFTASVGCKLGGPFVGVPFSSSLTAFIVRRLITNAGSYMGFLDIADTGSSDQFGFRVYHSNITDGYVTQSYSDVVRADPAALGLSVTFGLLSGTINPHIISAIHKPSDRIIYIDNVKVGQKTEPRLLRGSNQISVGGIYSDSYGYYLNGEIAEIIMYKTDLSQNDINRINSYLSERYNIL